MRVKLVVFTFNQNNMMWVVCVEDIFKIQWIKYLFLFSSQIQNLSCIVFDSIRTVLNLKVISSPSWWRPRETVCMGEAGGKVRLNLGLYLKALATCWCRPLVPSWRPAEMQQSWALVQQLLSQCHDNITQWLLYISFLHLCRVIHQNSRCLHFRHFPWAQI